MAVLRSAERFFFSFFLIKKKKEMLVVHISVYAVVKFNFFFFPSFSSFFLSKTAAHFTETYVKCAFERGWKKAEQEVTHDSTHHWHVFVLFSKEMACVYGGMSMARK